MLSLLIYPVFFIIRYRSVLINAIARVVLLIRDWGSTCEIVYSWRRRRVHVEKHLEVFRTICYDSGGFVRLRDRDFGLVVYHNSFWYFRDMLWFVLSLLLMILLAIGELSLICLLFYSIFIFLLLKIIDWKVALMATWLRERIYIARNQCSMRTMQFFATALWLLLQIILIVLNWRPNVDWRRFMLSSVIISLSIGGYFWRTKWPFEISIIIIIVLLQQ